MVSCRNHIGCLHSHVHEEVCLPFVTGVHYLGVCLDDYLRLTMRYGLWSGIASCIYAVVITMKFSQFLFDSCVFGQALSLCENAYRPQHFINVNGNDSLDWGWLDVQCLPCSSPELLFGAGKPFFPSLALLILPC